MIYELTKQQFQDTFTDKMIDITETTDAVADVWGYAEQLLSHDILSEADYKERYVEAVYANSINTYHHILLFGTMPNVYVVIVIDVAKRCVWGHHILNLNREYDLSDH